MLLLPPFFSWRHPNGIRNMGAHTTIHRLGFSTGVTFLLWVATVPCTFVPCTLKIDSMGARKVPVSFGRRTIVEGTDDPPEQLDYKSPRTMGEFFKVVCWQASF